MACIGEGSLPVSASHDLSIGTLRVRELEQLLRLIDGDIVGVFREEIGRQIGDIRGSNTLASHSSAHTVLERLTSRGTNSHTL